MRKKKIPQAQVMVIQGSETDAKFSNMFLGILKACNVTYEHHTASAHWHIENYGPFLDAIKQDIIVFIGGMSLVAPGIISAYYRNKGLHEKQIIGIPTDVAARSACEDLPLGTPLLTPGLNTVSVSHSIQNGALAVAKLVYLITKDPKIYEGLQNWFSETRAKKKIWKTELGEDGLIPVKEEKK